MYEDKVNHYAQLWGVDPQFANSIIRTESNYNPNAVSPTGARGLGQLTGPIIRAYGVTNPFDPDQSINASMRLLSENLQRRNGNQMAAAADYNGGIRQGDLVMAGRRPDKPETDNYLNKVSGQTRGENMGEQNRGDYIYSPGETQISMLPEAIKKQYVERQQSRAANLPLALGAMLSGDKGISSVGGALYEDAQAGMNPNKLNGYMTLMPDGTMISTVDPLVAAQRAENYRKSLQGDKLPQNAIDDMSKEQGAILRTQQLHDGFKDDYRTSTGIDWIGDVENAIGKKFDMGLQGQGQWWQDYNDHIQGIRKDLYGSSLTTNEKAAFDAANISPSMSPDVIRRKLKLQADIYQAALDRKARNYQTSGYNARAFTQNQTGPATNPAGSGRGDAAQAPSAADLLKVYKQGG